MIREPSGRYTSLVVPDGSVNEVTSPRWFHASVAFTPPTVRLTIWPAQS
ncbi:MAG: hypothetical protein AB7L13_17095 [Acidimicrobiia bacterium]